MYLMVSDQELEIVTTQILVSWYVKTQIHGRNTWHLLYQKLEDYWIFLNTAQASWTGKA